MFCRPSIAQIRTATLRRVAGLFRLTLNCGVGYRMILGKIETIMCLLNCRNDVLSENVELLYNPGETIHTLLRVEQPMARKTALCHLSGGPVWIFEDDILVHVLLPGSVWQAPLNGSGEFRGRAYESNAVVLIATERRCDCHHHEEAYGDAVPIGGPLLY